MTNTADRDKELVDIHNMMNSESGRRVFSLILQRAGLYSSLYSPDAPTNHIYFREGQRNLGLWLLSEIQEACPKLYLLMLEENNNE